MSANRILLVCSRCKSFDEALLIAERADAAAVFEPARFKGAAEWFLRHGQHGGPDDFQLAFHRPQNWDVSPPARDTPAGAVRLALANGSKHE